MNTKEVFAKGLAIRKEVLGEEYVNNSLANADEFSMPLQEYVTEHAWGAVWDRPGLTKKQRSMITLSILVAINRPHELKIHLRGALNNGVTKEEIRELFLHAAAYCGAPACVDAFRTAKEVFAE
jgi:4-carboxymuconolactone decarboxylase